MKRVKAACICQTLHFMCKDDLPYEAAAALLSPWALRRSGLTSGPFPFIP